MRPIVSGIAYQSPALSGAVDRDSGLIDYPSVRDCNPPASFGLTVQSFAMTRELEYPAARQHHVLRFTFQHLRLMVAVGARLKEVEGWVIFRCFGCGGSVLLPAGRSGLLRIPSYLVNPSAVDADDPQCGSVPVDALEQEWAGIGVAHRWNVDMVFEIDFPHRTVGRWTEVPGEIFRGEVVLSRSRLMSHFTFIQEVEVGAALGRAGWWTMHRNVSGDLFALGNMLSGLDSGSGCVRQFTGYGREPSGRVFRIVDDPDVLWNVRFRDHFVVSPLCILDSLVV